jgi:putative hydrolase of the HAD superfamily
MNSESMLENRSRKFVGEASAIRAVIFDYGDVLCQRGPLSDFAPMAEILNISAEQLVEHYMQNRLPYDRGDVTAAEYWGEFGREKGVVLSEAQVEELNRRDCDLWWRLDPQMLEWIDRLRAGGIKIGLLSNMFIGLAKLIRKQAPWLDRFDGLTLSAEIRRVKPEPEIYEHSLKQLGVAASEALFLDDRQVNIDGARAVRMEGLLFKTPSQVREDLKAWGFAVLPR